MSQSLSKLYTHIVFHTKHNQDLIKANVENELFAYLGGILKANKCVPIAINGIENHIHILCIQLLPQKVKTHGMTKDNFAYIQKNDIAVELYLR